MKPSYVYDDGGRAAAGYKGKAGDCVTRAEAERDALRECVKAADAMRTLQFDDLWEVREYDRARAKVPK